MAIQTLLGELWIPNSYPWSSATPGFSNFTSLNTAALRMAFIFQVPKSGTLDWFEFRQGLNTNTPDNGLLLAFQDLDSAGKPDNTDDQTTIITSGFAANTWLVPPSYMGTTGAGSGSKRSVTRNDWIACVIRINNFVASDSVAISGLDMAAKITVNHGYNSYGATSTNSGTTWTTSSITQTNNIAIKYDDGTYAYPGSPAGAFSAFNQRSYSSASTPDERGLLFQVPFPASLRGCWLKSDSDAGAFDIVLYDAASSVVSTIAASFGNCFSLTGGIGAYYFSSPVTLTKNVNYRLVVKPSASTVVTYDADFNSSAIRQANDLGSTAQSTSRTDAGAWSDSTTNLPFIGLIFDGFDDGTSGGGGAHSAVF